MTPEASLRDERVVMWGASPEAHRGRWSQLEAQLAESSEPQERRILAAELGLKRCGFHEATPGRPYGALDSLLQGYKIGHLALDDLAWELAGLRRAIYLDIARGRAPALDGVQAELAFLSLEIEHLLDAPELAELLAQHHEFLEGFVAPLARRQLGLADLACYEAWLDYHLGNERAALAELRTMARIAVVEHRLALREVLGLTASSTLDDHLRAQAQRRDFPSIERLMEAAAAAIARADTSQIHFLQHIPCGSLRLEIVDPRVGAHYPVAGYRKPAQACGQGAVILNPWHAMVWRVEMLELLVFHEGIPGHHLLESGRSERPALKGTPTWVSEYGAVMAERRALSWGLYSARGEEGVIEALLWRAIRARVDLGVHTEGWSHAQSIEFILRNSSLNEQEAEAMVVRVATWPGQALAYLPR